MLTKTLYFSMAFFIFIETAIYQADNNFWVVLYAVPIGLFSIMLVNYKQKESK